MVIVGVNIIPIGTKSPTVGEFIAEAINVLEEEGIKYEVGAMSTIIEGELDHVLDVIKKMHETPFRKGILCSDGNNIYPHYYHTHASEKDYLLFV